MDDGARYWNLVQERRMGELLKIARHARHDALRAREKLADVEQTVERQGLLVRALWDLVQRPSVPSEEDLFARMHELDDADGTLDGRLAPAALPKLPRNGSGCAPAG